jgi:hypothetical protein
VRIFGRLSVNPAFRERFEQLHESLPEDGKISPQRELLIGSYFMAEYSLESAALFNPSIVPHPDQIEASFRRSSVHS